MSFIGFDKQALGRAGLCEASWIGGYRDWMLFLSPFPNSAYECPFLNVDLLNLVSVC